MNAPDPIADLDAIIARARAAQARYEAEGSQQRYDRAAQAVAWAIMEPGRNRELAELAVRTTGLGNVPDKITKNHRKTLGLMRDIKGVTTFGVIREDPATGITEIARPKGVVAAIVPSTNPAATPANNIINALKCGNAIVVAPSPKGVPSCEELLQFIHAEFAKIGEDPDLVSMVPAPGSKDKTQRLMETCDMVVATGSQNNVHRAQTSGTPAVAVGAGNVTVIVDETADLDAAAEKIRASKTFDNATSCSSENSVVVVEAVRDAFIAAMARAGGAVVEDEAAVVAALWPDGHLNRAVIAQDADKMIDALGLSGKVPEGTEYIAVPTTGIGPDHPLSGEKLSRVLALYSAKDFDDAIRITREIQLFQGAGHSVGLHSTDDARPMTLARAIPTSRIIVNQAHTFATGGAFTNGMPFSLSMGCGSWGGNSIDENVHWKHFLQSTKIVREIPAVEPTLEDIFADYWKATGQ
ncbi:acylating sulfoacetaldehyde dehydrogenase [Roseovarius atlanticus]|uniref:acylating sulfoacetaldehyde dehydrogenase n=1 Tax=Roseovarius atlanticus TaxID=1641875 RepID=UPI001C9389F1|nr:aldehyde dehydrogenase family protein [Roseovarius atlanticus]MBY5990359.1 aldehyde dehydrogenase family protein [Roseovarius atlanticus]MBY6126905.1 aldehyde dehydrogenase family protein [Roseovarius atlanticus]MBY6151398.1 aldehyde dehydrogenase family protein [Roseovarius atlanticus]